MKLSSSTRVIVVALLLIAAGFGGWRTYQYLQLRNFELTAVEPGRVNLVAVEPGAGFRIIVSNQIAQLAEVRGEIGAGDSVGEGEVDNARRLPMRELLQALQGDEAAVGVLIEVLNNMVIRPEDMPPVPVVWSAEDIQRALDGDPEFAAQLEADINFGLDGQPLETLNIEALADGIIVELPVPVQVNVGGDLRTIEGRVRETFRTQLGVRFDSRTREIFDLTPAAAAAIYREEAQRTIEMNGEDVRARLERMLNPARLAQLADAPERVLSRSRVLVTDDFIEGASVYDYTDNRNRRYFDVTIRVSDEGRMRLWKFSQERPNFQLLLISDSVAIAAPVITTPLAERSVRIRRIADNGLIESAVDTMNQISATNP